MVMKDMAKRLRKGISMRNKRNRIEVAIAMRIFDRGPATAMMPVSRLGLFRL